MKAIDKLLDYVEKPRETAFPNQTYIDNKIIELTTAFNNRQKVEDNINTGGDEILRLNNYVINHFFLNFVLRKKYLKKIEVLQTKLNALIDNKKQTIKDERLVEVYLFPNGGGYFECPDSSTQTDKCINCNYSQTIYYVFKPDGTTQNVGKLISIKPFKQTDRLNFNQNIYNFKDVEKDISIEIGDRQRLKVYKKGPSNDSNTNITLETEGGRRTRRRKTRRPKRSRRRTNRKARKSRRRR